jgi:hypothetical protein
MIGVHGGAPTTKILNLRDAHEVKKSYFTKNFNFSRCPVHPKVVHGSAPADNTKRFPACSAMELATTITTITKTMMKITILLSLAGFSFLRSF